ncbi:uncharacterized protein LOC117109401 [Anneissia japonica]|uniref:uncharacterized protein LOC117109401 n=1 Tax=Anneissia japonica TaxID=1529436 RepID=UPI0014256CA5|nr:uncharacterized protein LOC117109401 [Anneissia japonica]
MFKKSMKFVVVCIILDAVLCNPIQETGLPYTRATKTADISNTLEERATIPPVTIRKTLDVYSQQKDLNDLYMRMAGTSCGKPRLKLINIYQELNVVREFGYSIYPECELIQRCEGSGCCGSVVSVCVAVERRNVSIKVLTNLSDPAKPPYFQNINLVSDTKCACRQTVLPERACAAHKKLSGDECVCRQPCAAPFIQDPETCECACDQQLEEKRCNKILNGERYMGGSHCQCVQNGECRPIQCNEGLIFNSRICKCETKY